MRVKPVIAAPSFPHENHGAEQYFFDPRTLDALTRFCSDYEQVACVCTPMLGRSLSAAGRASITLDSDERFAGDPGFHLFNLARPAARPERYNLLVCDPPFRTLSLSTVFSGLRALADGFEQPLLLAYPAARAGAVQGTFAPFGLRDTGARPGYLTVQTLRRNPIALFGNLSDAEHARLADLLA